MILTENDWHVIVIGAVREFEHGHSETLQLLVTLLREMDELKDQRRELRKIAQDGATR